MPFRTVCPTSRWSISPDSAHAPYGVRDADDVYRLTSRAVQHLWDAGCDLVILACNTASAVALRRMQENLVPDGKRVLGVFVPMIEALTERAWGDIPPRVRSLSNMSRYSPRRHRGQPRLSARTGLSRHRRRCRGAGLRRRCRCHRRRRHDPGRGAGARPCRRAGNARCPIPEGRDPRLHTLPAGRSRISGRTGRGCQGLFAGQPRRRELGRLSHTPPVHGRNRRRMRIRDHGAIPNRSATGATRFLRRKIEFHSA